MKKICTTLWLQFFVVIIVAKRIPTTLDGPFKPLTHRFDPLLHKGSDDLPMDHPRLKRNVISFFPEQIALALSTTSSLMWISWITGISSCYSSIFCVFLKKNIGYGDKGLLVR
uniref:Nucleotide pyrophosphatase/phosphodiesterase n=1 Tax=Solanum tuberosum TaxID=4113 RepID=M1D310_SOLTU